MSESVCESCRKPKAQYQCEICEGPVCRKCVQVLEKDTFSFLSEIPEDLAHTRYCGFCFDEKVGPELRRYQETMALAKDVFVFFNTRKIGIPITQKSKKRYEVKSCMDRDETILRLAFFAAQDGFNAIVDVEVTSKQIRHEAYQTSEWRGSGTGAKVDGQKVKDEDLQEQVFGR